MSYWAIINGTLTLTNQEGHTRARFWRDFVFRKDSFAGTSYWLMAALVIMCVTVTYTAIDDPAHYWGRSFAIAFGPTLLVSYMVLTYANYRRWIV